MYWKSKCIVEVLRTNVRRLSTSRPKFEKYSTAQIVEEALLLGALRGDLKSDEEKGFLRRGRPHKSVVTTQLLVASIAPPPVLPSLGKRSM